MVQDWYVADTANERWQSVRNGTYAPWSGTAEVLLVTQTATLSTADQPVQTLLAGAGYSVTHRSVDAAEDYTGIDVVVNTYGDDSVDGAYLHPPVGFVAIDSWRAFGMGGTLGVENLTNQVEVVDTSSPLAAGVSGLYDLYLSPAYITWDTAYSGAADVIVSRPSEPTQAVVFAYEAGSTMPGRFATTRHVAFGFHDDGVAAGLTADAEAQLLAAVEWAAGSAYVAPPVPSVPTGLAATAGVGQVSVSWTAVSDATSYTVKRATVTGGPYTEVATVTATSYTDTGLTDGVDYYYVVSAVNAGGASANSTEVSATAGVGTYAAGILVTSAEVSMWTSRSTSGPFKSSGDDSTNSPGHWDEMVGAMSTDWSANRWSGPTELDGLRVMSNRDGIGLANDPPSGVRQTACRMRDAAYVSLVQGNTTVPPAIVAEIEAQSLEPNLDFGDRNQYPYEQFFDQNPLFVYAVWLIDYMVAYDICKAMGYTSTRVEQWFADLADLGTNENDASLTDVFAGRATNDYTTSNTDVTNDTADAYWRDSAGDLIYGPVILRYYNNRRSALAGQAAYAAAMFDLSAIADSSFYYFREWVMFGHRVSDGVHGDWDRGVGSQTYGFNSLQNLLVGAEALARTGDTRIYDWSSSTGSPGTWGTAETDKSFEDVCNSYVKWINASASGGYADTYWDDDAANVGNVYFRHDTRRDDTGLEIVTDGALLLPAGYFNRADWETAVRRGAGSEYQFTASPHPYNNGDATTWSPDRRTRFAFSVASSPH